MIGSQTLRGGFPSGSRPQTLADGSPNIQFNVIFPRAHTYRVWVQFQRLGVVNTAYFDVPVKDLE